MTPSLRTLAAMTLLVALTPAGALAQSDADKTTARELGQSGETKFAAQDYKGAEADFHRANALFHAPTLLLGQARAQAAQGKVVEAWESYHSIILENVTSPPAFATALAEAQREIAAAEVRRAKVTITVAGADGPAVTIDDVPLKVEALGVARFMNPGPHTIKAVAGKKTATQALTIAAGSTQTVALRLDVDTGTGGTQGASTDSPPPPPPPASPTSWQMTAGYVAFGVGGAGLVVGIITGVLAIGKHSDLAKACGGGCPPSEDSALSSYHTLGALSTVGFIVGGVGAAAGAILVLTAPKQQPDTPSGTGLRVVPYLGLGEAGAVGTF